MNAEALESEIRRNQELEEALGRILDRRTGRNIVNQIADFYMRRIPSGQWVEVRQSTNDRLDDWVQHVLDSLAFGEDVFAIDACRGDEGCPAPKHVHGCYREHKASECLDEPDAPADWHLPEGGDDEL